MKVAAIIYHKNILSIYKRKWIDECINSLGNQTYNDFTIYELNYGDDELNLCEEYNVKQKHHFYKIKFNNHAESMNFLLSECLEDGIDIVFNNNMDDYSHEKRFELQLEKIKEGYDIVSSNFQFVSEDGVKGQKMNMSIYNPLIELEKGHNIICHPSVCYSRNFIENNQYGINEIPEEDFLLWKRTIKNFKFFVYPEYLIYYRFHKNQITTQHLLKDKEEQYEKETQRLFKELDIDSNVGNLNESKIIQQKINRIEDTFPTENIIVKKGGNVIRNLCSCGEPMNKVKYNYCQKCNKLY